MDCISIDRQLKSTFIFFYEYTSQIVEGIMLLSLCLLYLSFVSYVFRDFSALLNWNPFLCFPLPFLFFKKLFYCVFWFKICLISWWFDQAVGFSSLLMIFIYASLFDSFFFFWTLLGSLLLANNPFLLWNYFFKLQFHYSLLAAGS